MYRREITCQWLEIWVELRIRWQVGKGVSKRASLEHGRKSDAVKRSRNVCHHLGLRLAWQNGLE